MKFCSSTKDGIIQRATFFIFGDSQDHTVAYPLEDMTASANVWLERAGIRIWRVSGNWEYDDSNYVTLPVATTNLVEGQEDYALENTVFAVYGVSVKDSAGNWHKLKQFDMSELSVDFAEFGKTPGMPIYYDLLGNSIIIKPAPSSANVTLTGGLKVYLAREAKKFSVPASYATNDDTEPGFDEAFHDVIVRGIEHDYWVSRDSQKANNILSNIEILFSEMERHYGMKNKDRKTRIKPKLYNYR